MKKAILTTVLVLVLGLMVWPGKLVGAEPMGTAFTYQGRLLDANSPADGLYDLQFKLFDDPNVILGNQFGKAIDINGLDVMDGYFTVALDFGAGIFDGNAVWLEVGIRPGELADTNEFTVLWPCQEIRPTPYALYAASGTPGPQGSEGPKGDKGDQGDSGPGRFGPGLGRFCLLGHPQVAVENGRPEDQHQRGQRPVRAWFGVARHHPPQTGRHEHHHEADAVGPGQVGQLDGCVPSWPW